MPESLLVPPVAAESGPATLTGRSGFRSRPTVRRFARNRLAMTSAVLLLFVFAAGVIGPHLTPYGFAELTGDYSQPPSAKHWMGTDAIGHDLLAQVLRASQKSIQIALVVAALSTFIGVVVGTVAGYYRGWVDTVLSRLTDLVLVVPVLAVLLAAANSISRRGGNWFLVALLIAVFSGRRSRWSCGARCSACGSRTSSRRRSRSARATYGSSRST